MKSPLVYWINEICCLLYRGEYRRFIRVRDVRVAQEKLLLDMLTGNGETVYGIRHQFKNIKTAEDYKQFVPITVYEDYLPYIDEIKKGKKGILTAQDIRVLEMTSGSTSGSKYIPYTQELKDQFLRGIKPWIYDLYTNSRGVKWGKSYWSITPATAEAGKTEGGIPIGFEDDSAYLGAIEKHLFDLVFAVPGDYAKISDMETFYHKTAVRLLQCRQLSLISVWNPTYFLILLDYVEKHREALAAELPAKWSARYDGYIRKRQYLKIWPNLKVISCWSDGSAKPYADQLAALFPGIILQPKGVIATECFISFPIWGEEGSALSIHSHFFEFRSVRDGQIYLADELTPDEDYEVIVTTGGGFYRYAIGDILRVIRYRNGIPMIRFMGRAGHVSDLFGEKLNELFLKSIIEAMPSQPRFYMFAPDGDRYILYIDEDYELPDMDLAMRVNFHYDYCRKLGQLKNRAIFRLTGDSEFEYIEACRSKGQRLGDIKMGALSKQSGWDKIFNGYFEEEDGL